MSATRKIDNTEPASLNTLRHELMKLESAIHQANTNQLQTMINAHNAKLTANEITAQLNAAHTDQQARMFFYNHCNTMTDDLQSMISNKNSSSLFKRLNTLATKESLLKDVDLMIETLKLANQLISNPGDANNTLQLLAQHTIAVEAHLKNEEAATKKKRTWGSILIGLGILAGTLLITASLLGAGPVLATASLGAWMAYMFGMTTLTLATCVSLIRAGFHLSDSLSPARSQSDLCKEVPALHKTSTRASP